MSKYCSTLSTYGEMTKNFLLPLRDSYLEEN